MPLSITETPPLHILCLEPRGTQGHRNAKSGTQPGAKTLIIISLRSTSFTTMLLTIQKHKSSHRKVFEEGCMKVGV